MDRLTLGIAVDASRLETERFDEEVMRRRNVLVNQKWDDTLEFTHRLFSFCVFCLTIQISAPSPLIYGLKHQRHRGGHCIG